LWSASMKESVDAYGDRDADSGDAKAITALLGSWSGTGPLSIADAPYRAEYDLDRNGVIGGGDVLLAQSAAAAALPAGWVSASGPAGGPDSIVGFGGYLFNRETMYYTVRHRHYSPALGRFLERDPAGYIDGSNLFEYCGGGPLSWLDPWGLNRTWRDDAVDGIRAIGDWLFGDPGKEHAEWLNAVERDSGGRRRSICERYWRGEITAEEAQRLLDGETALVDGAHGLGEIVEAQADLIQEITITVATAYIPSQIGVTRWVNSRVVIGETMSRVKVAAFFLGARYYKAGPVMLRGTNLIKNADWLIAHLQNGGKVIDIGIDVTRKARSVYYQLETAIMALWRHGMIPRRAHMPFGI